MNGAEHKGGQRWSVETVLLGKAMSCSERDHQYQFRVLDKVTGQTVAAFHQDEIRTNCGSGLRHFVVIRRCRVFEFSFLNLLWRLSRQTGTTVVSKAV